MKKPRRRYSAEEKVTALEQEIQRKDAVLAALMAEHVTQEKSLGEL